GRAFLPSDEQPGAAPVAILRYSTWERRYASDPTVVGRAILIDGVPTTVIGIMPQRFSFPQNLDLWLPLTPNESLLNRKAGLWMAFGRLRDGVSITAARAEMDTIGRRLAAADPLWNADVVPVVHTFDDFFIGSNSTRIYGVLVGAVLFVLAIVCANMANMLLARAVGRTREVAVRLALGAERSRIVRQFLVESLMLAGLGSACGWLVARWSLRLYALAAVPPSTQFIGGSWFDHVLDFDLDARGLAYLVAISLTSGVLFGIAPAVRLLRTTDGASLKAPGHGVTAGRRGKRAAMVLVSAETALAVVLLAGAGVMVRSFMNLSATKLGVDADAVLTMLINLPSERYAGADARIGFYDRLTSTLISIPGVVSVTLANSPPASGAGMLHYELAGAPSVDTARQPTVLGLVVGAGYFRTMGAPVLAGREFDADDRGMAPAVAVVNQRFAEQQWPGENALGKRLRLTSGGEPGPWLTVVGVVSNIVQGRIARQRFDPLVYRPYRQSPTGGMWVLARTRVRPAALASAFRHGVQTIDPDLPVWLGPLPLAERLAATYAFTGVVSVLFAVFAGIALLLAMIGLSAVVGHFVSQRTQEIGIRVAMGARAHDIAALVFAQGLLPVITGSIAGLAGAFVVNRLLSDELVNVTPADPLTFIFAIVVLLLGAGLGCILPARHAMAVDPIIALRHD
ncbi:MAG TPA: ABC transporter permease, partial [Vicinamibacterales bacterium]|nr:ABC transporter permease [Vicinamibacterales bacterium]